MKILELTLRNIGAYYGENSFDLSVSDKDKNLILIGGKNGAGKTTLLESIKFCLFGPLAMGLKTDSETYYKKVESLFNKQAVSNGESIYQIILHTNQVEDFKSSKYKFIRTWEFNNNKIQENNQIIKDGEYLSEKEIEIFHSKLRQELPLHLFELFLFDGEEVKKIVSEKNLADYIQRTCKVLFGLDLFDDLEKDLFEYRSDLLSHDDISSNEKIVYEIENKIQSKQNQLKTVRLDCEKFQKEMDELDQQIRQSEKEFQTYGGVQVEKRNELNKQEREIEEKRKNNTEEIKNFVSTYLPFQLTKTLLHEAIEQIHSEKESELAEFAANALTKEKIQIIVDRLDEENGFQIINTDKANQVLLSAVKEMYKSDNNAFIHRLSAAQINEVMTMYDKVEKLKPKIYKHLLDQNQQLLKQAQSIRKKLNENDASSDLQKFLDQIKKLTREFEAKKTAYLQLEENEHHLIEEIKVLEVEKEKASYSLKQMNKERSSAVLTMNLIEVSKKFKENQLKKLLRQVELEALKMARRLFRKNNLITNLKISPVDFKCTLIGENHEFISIDQLSAGEKELLLLSILWAMFLCSGRKLPFVFDTLFGRLDQDHKKILIDEFLPKCGEQVIILSTDSEIDNHLFKQLSPYLQKFYTLDYDSIKQRAIVKKDEYFNFSKEEMLQ